MPVIANVSLSGTPRDGKVILTWADYGEGATYRLEKGSPVKGGYSSSYTWSTVASGLTENIYEAGAANFELALFRLYVSNDSGESAASDVWYGRPLPEVKVGETIDLSAVGDPYYFSADYAVTQTWRLHSPGNSQPIATSQNPNGWEVTASWPSSMSVKAQYVGEFTGYVYEYGGNPEEPTTHGQAMSAFRAVCMGEVTITAENYVNGSYQPSPPPHYTQGQWKFTAHPDGGTAPYTYSWGDSDVHYEDGFGPGEHTVSVGVTDAVGCTAVGTYSFMVVQGSHTSEGPPGPPPPPPPSSSWTPPSSSQTPPPPPSSSENPPPPPSSSENPPPPPPPSSSQSKPSSSQSSSRSSSKRSSSQSSSSRNCPPGFTRVGEDCVPPPCPEGQYWNGVSCITPPPPPSSSQSSRRSDSSTRSGSSDSSDRPTIGYCKPQICAPGYQWDSEFCACVPCDYQPPAVEIISVVRDGLLIAVPKDVPDKYVLSLEFGPVPISLWNSYSENILDQETLHVTGLDLCTTYAFRWVRQDKEA